MKSKIELILRERTLGMFNDGWYSLTATTIDDLINEDTSGYVYFIKSETTGYTKIGISKNINNRLNAIRQTNGELFVWGFLYTDDYINIEKGLHVKFKEKRKFGEWFLLERDEILDEIKELNGSIVCNAFNKKIDMCDGVVVNASNLRDLDPNIRDILKRDLPIGIDVDKRELYNILSGLGVSPKKCTFLLKDYCSQNGYKLKEWRTHSARMFRVEI